MGVVYAQSNHPTKMSWIWNFMQCFCISSWWVHVCADIFQATAMADIVVVVIDIVYHCHYCPPAAASAAILVHRHYVPRPSLISITGVDCCLVHPTLAFIVHRHCHRSHYCPPSSLLSSIADFHHGCWLLHGVPHFAGVVILVVLPSPLPIITTKACECPRRWWNDEANVWIEPCHPAWWVCEVLEWMNWRVSIGYGPIVAQKFGIH